MILNGDCLEILKTLPDRSVQTCITSPPYWGLRDYGVDGQIGLEETLQEFISKMVAVFSEVRRVLKDNGTLWLNLGDTYAGGGNNAGNTKPLHEKQASYRGSQGQVAARKSFRRDKEPVPQQRRTELPAKNLVGVPWRVALALQDDGWILRQDIIWHKPNPMPESVTDRYTKAHEYIFLLSKAKTYVFNQEAIFEPFVGERSGQTKERGSTPFTAAKNDQSNSGGFTRTKEGKNKRSVWTVNTGSFKGAHFATFPKELITPCVLAGSQIGDIVLDPFFGSGTTGLVAQEHQRKYIGIELNPEYIKIAEQRLSGSLFSQTPTTE